MEKNLTTEESLGIIAKMISNTRRNFNDHGGNMFLIWGYTSIAVTLVVYTAFYLTKSYDAMWLWLALPLIGGVLTWFHYRKYRKPVQTFLDKAANYVWIAFSAAAFACMVFMFATGGRVSFPCLFITLLMMSVATATTGLIIKFRPMTVMGFAGIAISFLTWAFDGMDQFIVFAIIMLVLQVIPGHMLNAACRREAREAKERRDV